MRDDVVSSTIQLISETTSQQGYMAQQLWSALEKDTADKQPLTQIATWCIGEYGDLLLYAPDSPIKVRISTSFPSIYNNLWAEIILGNNKAL